MQLVAPQMLTFELTNICRTKIRQRPAERAALLAAFARLTRHLDAELVTLDKALARAATTR